MRYEPRRFGKSNFGLFRTYKVLLDLLPSVPGQAHDQADPTSSAAPASQLRCGALTFSLALYLKLSGQKDFVREHPAGIKRCSSSSVC